VTDSLEEHLADVYTWRGRVERDGHAFGGEERAVVLPGFSWIVGFQPFRKGLGDAGQKGRVPALVSRRRKTTAVAMCVPVFQLSRTPCCLQIDQVALVLLGIDAAKNN
jgi:hypothetical protein